MSKQVKKEIFLEHLPCKGKLINWKDCIGYKIKFIYGEIEDYIEITNYFIKNNIGYLTIKYDKNEINITPSTLRKCSLGGLLKKKTSDFKIEIGTKLQDDKRDIIITDREYRKKEKCNQKWYKYTCNVCGWTEGWNLESQFLGKYKVGCSCCSNRTPVLGMNTIWDTDRWMCDLGLSEEDAKTHTFGSNDKVKVVCPDCGVIKNKLIKIADIYTRHSIECTCGDGYSYGHKYIHNLLTQLNQKFVDNHTFEWCKFYNTYKNKYTTGEYDFVLEDMKLIIEVDGGFHRRDNIRSGQTKEESVFLDNEKNRLAEEHGYKVIRIIYNDNNFNIKQNILDSDLNRFFELSKIYWNKCEEFALSSRVKEACELWNSGIHSTKEIGEIMKLHQTTVIRYLKKGSLIWNWYEYNLENEKSKRNKKGALASKQIKSKPIEMFKNNISLGIFESASELERKSEELFGIYLDHRAISSVCSNKKTQYKGYTFKYYLM